jgi:hypothetical protein
MGSLKTSDRRPDCQRDYEKKCGDVDLAHECTDEPPGQRRRESVAVPPRHDQAHREEWKCTDGPDFSLQHYRDRVHSPKCHRPQPWFTVLRGNDIEGESGKSRDRNDVQQLNAAREIGWRRIAG